MDKNKYRQKINLLSLIISMFIPMLCLGGIIDENRIWHYTMLAMGSNPAQEATVRFKMKFEGTQEIDGKLYHILKTIESKEFRRKYPNIEWDYYRDIECHSRFYIREESQKVYIYDRIFGNCFFFEGHYDNDDGANECLLYDFGLNVGESYVYQMDDRKINLTLSEQIYHPDCDMIVNFFTNYNRDYVITIDGIGFLTTYPGRDLHNRGGCISFLNVMLESGYLSTTSEAEWLPVPSLVGLLFNKVTDLDNNTIFELSMLEQSGYIESIDSHQYHKSEIYDIHGRNVQSVVPGSIYIQNGNKFVAR